jgi:hypothetical protein
MSNLKNRMLVGAAVALLVAGLSSCEVTGVGVDSDVGVGYSSGYYEPYGYDYGGWGGGYYVAPGRPGFDHRRDDHGGGDHHFGHGGGHAPAYRPAPPGRGAPSLPHGGRGGGGHR